MYHKLAANHYFIFAGQKKISSRQFHLHLIWCHPRSFCSTAFHYQLLEDVQHEGLRKLHIVTERKGKGLFLKHRRNKERKHICPGNIFCNPLGRLQLENGLLHSNNSGTRASHSILWLQRN